MEIRQQGQLRSNATYLGRRNQRLTKIARRQTRGRIDAGCILLSGTPVPSGSTLHSTERAITRLPGICIKNGTQQQNESCQMDQIFFLVTSMAWVQIYLDKFQVKKQSIVKIINNNYLICWGEFVCDQGRLSLFYMRQLCDLRRSICKANSGVLNRHHDARGKFLPAGICSVLTFVVLAHVWAGLYPPDSSWTTIELPLKVLQGPNFPMLILCAAIKLMLFIYSLAPQWFGLCDISLCIWMLHPQFF